MYLILVEKWYWLNKTNYNFNSHRPAWEKKNLLFCPSHFLLTTQLPPPFPSNCLVFPSLISCPFFLPPTPPIPLPPLSRSSGQVVSKQAKPWGNLRFRTFTRRPQEATKIPAIWGIFNLGGHFTSGTFRVQDLTRQEKLGKIKASSMKKVSVEKAQLSCDYKI